MMHMPSCIHNSDGVGDGTRLIKKSFAANALIVMEALCLPYSCASGTVFLEKF